jgi:glycosyltransferase involved in cell wall biosynthesis
MRVLISTRIFPNRQDGTRGIYILKQAISLARNVDVRVVSPVPWVPPFPRARQYTEYALVPARDTIGGLDVTYPRFFVTPKVARFLHGWFATISLAKTYEEIIGEFRPDVILGFFAYPDGFANLRIARRHDLPVVTGVLGSDINRMAARGLQRVVIARSLAKTDKILSVSRALAAEVVRLGVPEERVVVIPNGIDLEQFVALEPSEARARLGLDDTGKIVLCVSRLSDEKGVDTLVKAYGLLTEKESTLIVVGHGDQRSRLEAMVAELDLGGRVRMVGRRPHSEIPLWMGAADVVVLPSRLEGHPNALVEAHACGRPVVAARVGGVPETIQSEEHGLLVEPDDPIELSRAIREALVREWDRRKILRKGRARSWDKVASELLDELRKTIAEFEQR